MSDILERAKNNYQLDKEHWNEIYRKARDDLYFISDKEDAQWDPADRRLRGNRPCLTIDQLGQFVHQVANTVRMNTPTINIIPGTDGDVETAEVYKGLIKNIEYRSNSDEAYDTASLSAIRCSIGFIFVDHGYSDDVGFEQEFTIKRCPDALQVWLDRNSIEADGSDARHGTKIQPMSVQQFKSRYPKAKVSSFSETTQNDYRDEDIVNVAEYYEIQEETKEIGLLSDGEIQEKAEDVEYASTRILKKIKVMRYILSGEEVLAESRFPGKYVPIVPVYGEEAWIDGKRQLFSLIRKSKDSQRMYNYWASLETELLMKQPVAPIMVGAGQIENYKEDWLNPHKSMALRYETHDADGNALPAPQRLEPPTTPTGIVNARRTTVDDIKATMGIYNASLGQASNETSGVAISRRKEEGDVATYHFGDNLVRSITQVGRILVAGIPEIIDTPRILQIIGAEGEPKLVGVNGAMAKDQKRPFDLKTGQYGVRVVTGTSFTTQRQEAAEFFRSIVEKQPELMQVMGDLLFKNMDFTGAQQMAERMKKVIDPKLIDESNDQPPIDLEKEQMKMVIEQGKQMLDEQQAKIAELEQQLKNKDGEIQVKVLAEENSAQNDQAKIQIEIIRLQTEQEKVRLEHEKAKQELDFKMAALALKQRELDLKAQDMQMRAEQEQENMRLQSEQAQGQQQESDLSDS